MSVLYKDSLRTAQLYKTSLLILCKAKVTVCCETYKTLNARPAPFRIVEC